MKLHPLRAEREVRGWSQAKIAKALGISTRTVSRWEQGLAVPHPYYRELLSSLFGKTVGELALLSDLQDNDEMEDHSLSVAQRAVSGGPAQEALLIDPAIPAILGGA